MEAPLASTLRFLLHKTAQLYLVKATVGLWRLCGILTLCQALRLQG